MSVQMQRTQCQSRVSTKWRFLNLIFTFYFQVKMNSPITSGLLYSNVTNITTQLIIFQIIELAKITSRNHDILLDKFQEVNNQLNKTVQEVKAIKSDTQYGNKKIEELKIQIKNCNKSEQLYNKTKQLEHTESELSQCRAETTGVTKKLVELAELKKQLQKEKIQLDIEKHIMVS